MRWPWQKKAASTPEPSAPRRPNSHWLGFNEDGCRRHKKLVAVVAEVVRRAEVRRLSSLDTPWVENYCVERDRNNRVVRHVTFRAGNLRVVTTDLNNFDVKLTVDGLTVQADVSRELGPWVEEFDQHVELWLDQLAQLRRRDEWEEAERTWDEKHHTRLAHEEELRKARDLYGAS